MSVPVAPMPSTNLWTGIWYLVDLKATGRLTWAYAKAGTGHHVQTAAGPEFKKYEERGQFWNDGHWMIIPAEEKPGFYLLKNKTCNGYMTWEGHSSTTATSKWATIIEGSSGKYLAGGKFRIDALWYFDAEDGPRSDFYQLKNAALKGNGILTWSGATTGFDKTNWLQIATVAGEGSDKHDKDYLWSFTNLDPFPTRPSIFSDNTVASIPGTNLRTGVWYLVDLRANGRLTWAYAKDKTGHHVQIASGPEFKKYEKEGQFWEDGQWMIHRAPEKVNEYLLRNKTKPHAVITWEGQSTTMDRSKWAVAIDGQDTSPDWQSDGRFRKDALWRIEGRDGVQSSHYQLLNSSFPQNGVLTWSGARTGFDKTNWLQIVTVGREGEDKNDKDYLWEFTPVQ